MKLRLDLLEHLTAEDIRKAPFLFFNGNTLPRSGGNCRSRCSVTLRPCESGRLVPPLPTTSRVCSIARRWSRSSMVFVGRVSSTLAIGSRLSEVRREVHFFQYSARAL